MVTVKCIHGQTSYYNKSDGLILLLVIPGYKAGAKNTNNSTKDEAFDPAYQNKTSGDVESSFTLVPKESEISGKNKKERESVNQKITPAITKVTQDKHPSKYCRMSSFT